MRALVIVLFLGWGLFSSHYYVCEILHQCEAEVVVPPPATDRLADLGLRESGNFVLNDFEHFKFAENDNNPDLTANNEAFLNAVATYLKENPKNNLKLTGFYLPSEESPDSYTNMGVSRAAKIRDLLVAKGFDSGRFDISGEVLEEGAKLDRPIGFDAIVPKVVEDGGTDGDVSDEPVAVVQTIDNRTYYFEYGSDAFTPDPPFIRYMDEIKDYLAQEGNKDKLVYVVGHTDKNGSLRLNKNLSNRRASQVRAFIVQSGISKAKTKTEGKWYKEQVDVSGTDEGDAKNRRVQILIK